MPGKSFSHISIIAIGMVLLCQPSDAWAQEEHVVELPILFSQEGIDVKTSVCLRVREKVYDAARAPWATFPSQTSPETYLTETIAAMVNKDNSRLMELSHPRLGRDPKKFQKQASAYFRQFEVLQPGDVWGHYHYPAEPCGLPVQAEKAYSNRATGSWLAPNRS